MLLVFLDFLRLPVMFVDFRSSLPIVTNLQRCPLFLIDVLLIFIKWESTKFKGSFTDSHRFDDVHTSLLELTQLQWHDALVFMFAKFLRIPQERSLIFKRVHWFPLIAIDYRWCSVTLSNVRWFSLTYNHFQNSLNFVTEKQKETTNRFQHIEKPFKTTERSCKCCKHL